MKKFQRFCVLFLLMMGVCFPTLRAQSYDNLWKQVEQAKKQSLPQTVVKLTEKIYRKAEQEKNAPQMLKAYTYRTTTQERLTPDSLYTNLKDLERWAKSDPDPVNKAILHSLLANEYADYMRSNRWGLSERRDLELEIDEVPADIREWSSNLFAAKIDEHAQASLQDSRWLLEVSAKKYVPFVVLEDKSLFYGHDMYNLLVWRAVSSYKKLTKSPRTDSLKRVRIDGIYTEMINTYRHRSGAEDAVVLSTLDYWEWKTANGVDSEPYETHRDRKEQLDKGYRAVLDSLIREYGTREVCAEAYICKVKLLRKLGETYADEALQVCDEGLRRYPAYKRINELRNIRENILQPFLEVSTRESIYPGDSLVLNMSYRNLKGFTLNLYRTDLSEVPWMDTGINKAFYQKHARKLSATHFELGYPAKRNGKQGTSLRNLQHKVQNFHVPEETGVYILQVVPDEATARTEEHFLVSTRFKVLTLSLRGNRMELVTLDGRSGQPIADATIGFYSSYNEKERNLVKSATTDAGGKAVIEWDKRIRSYVARKGTDAAMMPQTIYMSRYNERRESRQEEHITLLTDRSLYRPGQTVYVKGISYEQEADSAHVLAGKNYQVRLLDVNRKELAQQAVSTNEFGSFTAEFTLPAVCLNGDFAVEVDGKASVSVRVEEYKRPTFEIAFNPIKQAFCFGDTVAVTGSVKSYTGVAVQDVPLAYTITRCQSWDYYGQKTASLVSDTVRLDAVGNFSLPVFLKPERDTDRVNNVGFYYLVEVAVTSDAGETQTSQYRLSATGQTYFFTSDVGRELCKENVLSGKLSVKNAVNEIVAMEGVCRLYPVVNTNTGKISDKAVYESTFKSGELKDFAAWRQLPSGEYRLVLSVRGRDGKEVSNADNAQNVVLFSLADKRPATFMETFLYEKNKEFDATHPALFYFGTSMQDVYVLVDVFGQKGRLKSRTLSLSDSIFCMKFPYEERYGSGVSMLFTFVKNGRMYSRRVELRKRLPQRTLDMKWEVFRDRLRPGQEEEWKLVIKTPQGFPAAAEMLATMYDASLDRIYSRNQSLSVYYNRFMPYFYRNISLNSRVRYAPYFPTKSWKVPFWRSDYFYNANNIASSLAGAIPGIQYSAVGAATKNMMIRGTASADAVELKYVPVQVEAAEEEPEEHAIYEMIIPSPGGQILQPAADVRTNFAETAFFYPQLRTNEQGEIAFSFTMPQSLTRWNFRGYSHTKDMMTGMLDATAVTVKEFMLTPNMPRFVRVGDKTEIAAGIANLADKAVKGTAVFTLFDPMTEKVISVQRQKFSVEAGKTASVSFRFSVTDRYGLLGVRMVADGGAFSDGEQHLLPVLSNKEYITETLAMPVRGKETRIFSLDGLFNGNSRTATDRRLTVEFTGNPAWYAVQALPALNQPATDNAIAWATAFYANSLAGHIANSQPRIKAVFDSWRLAGGTKETSLSQLEKNQDVKNILLDESPWLLEATTETERQQRIATLFDVNQLEYRNASSLLKLKELQGEEGAWSWFGGMSGSRYVTSYVTGLLVRLSSLTEKALPEEAAAMKSKAFEYLNKESLKEYRAMRKAEKSGTKVTTLSAAAMEYMYLVALGSENLSGEYSRMFDYFLTKLGENLENGTMVRKAQSAVILCRAGRKAEADKFVASLKEHLVQTDEQGAHFAFHATPYAWGMMPVPAHVAVMEALREVGGNDALVEEMKLWLLKQKQATVWDSPVATANAVYALLCKGSDLLESKGNVRITLGNSALETVSPVESAANAALPAKTAVSSANAAVPGLGYIKKSFAQGTPEQKATSVTVEKRDEGIAWGAVYAQYLSPLSDVKQQGGELNIEKKLFVERISANGQKRLQPLTAAAPLSVGDKVVSRLTIRLDRAMDFIQLKDQRGACFEPVGSLSGYRWSNGFGYYMEVEDAGTNFFFDHLGKGVYVLEHSCRVARGGTYETGLATVQCAYAPEYASHSAGGTVVAK